MTRYHLALRQSDMPNNQKIIIIIAIALILVLIVAYIAISNQVEQMREEQTIDSMYSSGKLFIDIGDSKEAFGTFIGIIHMDPSQEKAWHEAGKILNRLEICPQALDHHERYVEAFPYSERAMEGYETAKQC
jgi:outer membrane protein assembly factor BamD (BamD/ComL family)